MIDLLLEKTGIDLDLDTLKFEASQLIEEGLSLANDLKFEVEIKFEEIVNN